MRDKQSYRWSKAVARKKLKLNQQREQARRGVVRCGAGNERGEERISSEATTTCASAAERGGSGGAEACGSDGAIIK